MFDGLRNTNVRFVTPTCDLPIGVLVLTSCELSTLVAHIVASRVYCALYTRLCSLCYGLIRVRWICLCSGAYRLTCLLGACQEKIGKIDENYLNYLYLQPGPVLNLTFQVVTPAHLPRLRRLGRSVGASPIHAAPLRSSRAWLTWSAGLLLPLGKNSIPL